MRPLTEEETRVMFEKIAKYIRENLQLLVDRPDGTYCFRLHNDRVYYVSEKILKLAANVSGDKLVSLGTCFGKFTKTHKFRLHITALDYLAPYAKYKVWIKPGAEQSFLYGNHVLKSGLGRITENTSQYQGVVVYSMADIPLEEATCLSHRFERTSAALRLRSQAICFSDYSSIVFPSNCRSALHLTVIQLPWEQKTAQI
ncbi:60S ribosome subunit biogenesis protein NIP7 homolog isoform X1 [Manis javanica]|uniref:60S ribosome subunit biogenesis protein NIP7 homolog isoform X1 n=1 Tax=Manis javanica TaxID=9974 RepID=UPI001879E54B|nr:60S ribosome subunit biogenesis protein NIP7 homolog isoform X2 [Manis javanica]